MVSETERGWAAIFGKMALRDKLDSEGIAFVSAADIKKWGNREPRLMTKFDSRAERPNTLQGITILPTRNGRYALVVGDGYRDMEVVDHPTLHRSDRLQGIESLP